MSELILDLSNPQVKAQLLTHVRTLEGMYRVTVAKYRKRRSDLQNRYYRGVIVPIFADWCRANGNDWTDEQAHKHLAKRFLEISFTDERTGEMIESVRSTSDLTTVEFMNYEDKCCQFIAEFCEIEVPPPDPYYKEYRLQERMKQAEATA